MEDIKLTVTAQVAGTSIRETARGKLYRAYEVTVGWVRVTRRNKAKAEATRILQAWIDASDGPPRTVRFKNSAAVLTAVPTERANEIGVYQVCTGTNPDGSFFCRNSNGSHKDWDAAKAYARQRLVSDWVNWHDDACVLEGYEHLVKYRQTDDARELLRYAGFQRAWVAAPEDCPDRHRWAGDHQSEFTPDPADLAERVGSLGLPA